MFDINKVNIKDKDLTTLVDTFTKGLFTYDIEFMRDEQIVHITLHKNNYNHYHFYAPVNKFLLDYIEHYFLEIYKMFNILNAEEEYKKRRSELYS